MTYEEMVEVIQAHIDGKTIEVRIKNDPSGEWNEIITPEFNFGRCAYRIKNNPIEINWDTVPEGYNYFAVDKDNSQYFFKDVPGLNEKENFWYPTDSRHDVLRTFGIAVHCHWKNSLTVRPESE